MHLLIASDHAGVELKASLTQHLQKQSHSVEDLGPSNADSVDYPDYAEKLCKQLLQRDESAEARTSLEPRPMGAPGGATGGILICGSGIGMSIAANRFKGIRAALCYSVEAAKLSRQHNDANVLVLSARLANEATNKEIVDAFLATPFEGGRHQRRVEKMG